MRLFAAIPLSDEATDALDLIAETIPVGDPTPEDQWHITLAFAQDVDEETAEEFALNISQITMPRFDWSIAGFGAFGGDKLRQIHALIAPDSALLDVHKRVRRAARDAGLQLPHKRFVPHVTLSRLRGAPMDMRGADWLAKYSTRTLGPFTADAVVLFESELYRNAPRYSPIITCRLV